MIAAPRPSGFAAVERSREAARNVADLARSIDVVSKECDALCLGIGTFLSEAVPRFSTLSTRFHALAEGFGAGKTSAVDSELGFVAGEVRQIGLGLTTEGHSLDALIKLNLVLSLRISNVADDVRFLVAMVSNAKVELATIQDHGEELIGFGHTLQDLASKADGTLRLYQSTHDRLLAQLRNSAKVHRSFESSHRDRLVGAAQDIEAAAGASVTRHKHVAASASEIAAASQTIGVQIAQSVMALQIGDSTRQRIEHASEALMIAHATLENDPRAGDMQGMWGAVSRLGRLQQVQIAEAAVEFKSEIENIGSLLGRIADEVEGLVVQKRPIKALAVPADGSFRGDLEAKLKTTEHLIGQCLESRVAVDGIVVSVISTFEELERLAASVAAMVIDMTIIGTNAIVKSYRLGQRGAGLSIIAQHLRSHALKVAEGIKLLTPAMTDVRGGAKDFIQTLESQDAERMKAIASRMTAVFASFTETGVETDDAMKHLEKEATEIGGVLRKAITRLDVVVDYEARLNEVVDAVGVLADDFDESGATVTTEEDQALDHMLKPRYTMAAERNVHKTFFASSDAETDPML